MTVEVAAVETIQPGDVLLSWGDGRVVAEVNEYPTTGVQEKPCVVVTYFNFEQTSYENKASAPRQGETRQLLCYASLKPLAPGEMLPVRRGTPGDASELRARLEEEEQQRWDAQRNRWKRAQRFDEKRARS